MRDMQRDYDESVRAMTGIVNGLIFTGGFWAAIIFAGYMLMH
jgi:hypothetical protein